MDENMLWTPQHHKEMKKEKKQKQINEFRITAKENNKQTNKLTNTAWKPKEGVYETTTATPRTKSIKKWIYILPISRFSKVIYMYFVYRCQNYRKTKYGTQR